MRNVFSLSSNGRTTVLAAHLTLLVLAAGGCRSGPLAEYYSWNPFVRGGNDDSSYGPSPAIRREQLQQLARDVRKMSPSEKLQLAADLSLRVENEIDPLLRGETVKTLGQIGTDRAKEALRLAVHDAEVNVRVAACQAWQDVGGPEAVQVLTEVLASDTDEDVRLAAVRALGAFQDPAAARGLALALDDGNPALQYRAMESLHHATGQNLGHDVVAWRNYVQQGAPPTGAGPALVERDYDRR
ncbi:MAG: HEAT repeat domain-containing protein [Planctomycetales bacterium]|nr:HEAT repeat domain-containing protein [Planctomycetales bacterium]